MDVSAVFMLALLLLLLDPPKPKSKSIVWHPKQTLDRNNVLKCDLESAKPHPSFPR